MSDMVLIPLGGLGVLRLTREQFDAALVPATAAAPAPVAIGAEAAPALLTPEECAALSHTARSWWIRKARRGEIECTRVGRLVRFTREQVQKALSGPATLDHGITTAGARAAPRENKPFARTRNNRVTAIVPPRSGRATPREGAE